ncbi:sirohydrochlorin chelatase [Angustibacter sp. McL0619]|uniref:sirohydrochlorin chelatase n=1 Tax=Angustibacter sp. McL0619 TaxID=3415676 RepID=UPI003CE7E1D4
MRTPVLVACSHGTRDLDGRRAVRSLVSAVAAARPGQEVREAFVDVQQPEVADVVREITDLGRAAVVVPLLLSIGYHVEVDVARAVAGRDAVAAAALGPDERLTALLLERLHSRGLAPQDALVLAAAGSSDPQAGRAVERVAEALRHKHSGPVSVGYAAAARPSVAEAVAASRADDGGRRVTVASYLLAPGHFHSLLGEAGADVVTDPLLPNDGPPDARLVELVLARYDAASATLRR